MSHSHLGVINNYYYIINNYHNNYIIHYYHHHNHHHRNHHCFTFRRRPLGRARRDGTEGTAGSAAARKRLPVDGNVMDDGCTFRSDKMSQELDISLAMFQMCFVMKKYIFVY